MVDQRHPQIPPTVAGTTPAHPVTPGDSRPYADTDRFGATQVGEAFTKPILDAENKITDPEFGTQAPVGGTPDDPEIC